MIREEVEHEVKDIVVAKKIRKFNKKWLLIPSAVVLIVTPLTLSLVLGQRVIAPNAPKIVDVDFSYKPLDFDEFKNTISNHQKIESPYIAGVTKELELYLPEDEWNKLDSKTTVFTLSPITEHKIINNLSSKLRLINLISSDKEFDVEDFYLFNFDFWTPDPSNSKKQFTAELKYQNEDEHLVIGGSLNLSETGESIKEINNATMPELLGKLNTPDFANKINLSYGFSYYGMETIGEKDKSGKWLGNQKINLNNFYKITLTWFLDFLKKTNLIDYSIDLGSQKLNFYVEGWDKDKLVNLNDKNGLWFENDYVVLSKENYPISKTTGKAASIVSAIDFGWWNPLNNTGTSIGITGSYLVTPVGGNY